MRAGASVCQVSKAAYERGYGTKEEIVRVPEEPQNAWRFDSSAEAGDWNTVERKRAH